ncbi:MAG: molybdopterin-dependent oxidoreductase [Rhizobiales bacterium]|nr:molybdopterin-dependent oxidoreductase [Hyphomicrobiales bacterium]
MTAQTQPSEFVGKAVERLDGPDKVTGRARYTADVFLPGMLIGRCLRSPYASARIVSIDTSKAKRVPGVFAILTGADVAGYRYGRVCRDIPILAQGVVRFVGEKVAAVAAETAEAADTALSLIRVEYEELPFVVDVHAALRDDAHRVHDQPPKVVGARLRNPGDLKMYPPLPNVISQLTLRHGNPAEAFAQADHQFQHTFNIPSVHQGYIEPHSCLIAASDDGDVDVWMSNKAPHGARAALAEALSIPKEKITLNPVFIGGDFGGKGGLMDAPLCYHLALHARRPVKMVMNSFEELTAANPRHAASITLTTALDRNARILAMKARMIFNSGAYAGFCPVPTIHGYTAFAGPYKVPNCDLEVLRVYTNAVPAGHMRSPGGPQITFAVESHLDMIARDLQLDPCRFRRDNAIAEGDLSPIGERRQFLHCRAVIDAAIREFGWDRPKGADVGRGIALYEYPPGTFDDSNVVMSIDGAAKVDVAVGAPDTGTGFHTIVAQLTAGELQLPLNDIRVAFRDTGASPFERGPSGSRLTTTIQQAIKAAVDAIKTALTTLAAERLGAREGDVRYRPDGLIEARGKSIDLKALMAWAEAAGKAPVVRHGKNTPTGRSDVTCFAAQIAEVGVDRETGQIRVNFMVTAHDVGQVINPITHQGQIEGGLVQAFGQTVCERLHFGDDGAVISATLGDYKLPTVMDIPDLTTILLPVPTAI